MKNKKSKLILIAAISAFVTYIINKLIVTMATIDNKLFSYNSSLYAWKQGNIFYTKQGSGSPLLLLHDLDAFSSDYEWHKVVSSLEANHTVYTLDLIGCGRSDKPKITYTNYLYVQLITDFIRDVICTKTNVVSTGLSGTFVTMSCFQNPSLFDKLIFINPTNMAETNSLPIKSLQLKKKLLELPLVGPFIFNLLSSKHNIRTTFENKYFYNKDSISNKYINIYHESAHTNDTYSRFLLASILSSFTNVNTNKALAKLSNRIFMLFGDQINNLEIIMDEYSDVNSSIEMSTIPNTKHLPQMENPESIIRMIDEILTFEK
jgi:pimeloyl-ACP methyl ester carboxylesterase